MRDESKYRLLLPADDGYAQPRDLTPVSEALSPIRPGDRVALPDRPFAADDGSEYVHPHDGKYGIVKAVGIDSDGHLRYDLHVFDPNLGVVPDEEPVIYRAHWGEIQ